MSKPIDASHSGNPDAIAFVEFLHLPQNLQNYDFCNQKIKIMRDSTSITIFFIFYNYVILYIIYYKNWLLQLFIITVI